MKKIVVFGSGGHSKVIIDIIEKIGVHRIIGLIDDGKPVGTKVFGYPVIGGMNDLGDLIQDIDGGVVAVGDNWRRNTIVNKILANIPTFHFFSLVHPTAIIGRNVTIGSGTVVMAGAIIGPDTTIGVHSIINTNASVDHDCSLEDFVTIAPRATLAGTVIVGTHSVVSLGAVVKHNISIGKHTVIGAGAVVLRDVEDSIVSYGAPARKVRDRVAGDQYL